MAAPGNLVHPCESLLFRAPDPQLVTARRSGVPGVVVAASGEHASCLRRRVGVQAGQDRANCPLEYVPKLPSRCLRFPAATNWIRQSTKEDEVPMALG